MTNKKNIPVCKPLLPTAAKLTNYLQIIDESRHYTNFGSLELSFREKLAALAGTKTDYIVTTSSGTTALELAIRALD